MLLASLLEFLLSKSTFPSPPFQLSQPPGLAAALATDSFEKAVLTNTNVGGENCHRGAALGALMGAALGECKIPARFIEGLHDS